MPPTPAVAATLAKWHEFVVSRDVSTLPALVHPNARFRSPMAHEPYHSRDAVVLILSTVINVFEDFTYYRTLLTDDGRSVVLEFSANVNGKKLKGIDLITFDEQGLITEFEVMVRPMSGLQALGGEMGNRLKEILPKFKGKL